MWNYKRITLEWIFLSIISSVIYTILVYILTEAFVFN